VEMMNQVDGSFVRATPRAGSLTAKLTAEPTAARDPWWTLVERMRW
jgi:hypothetical protein